MEKILRHVIRPNFQDMNVSSKKRPAPTVAIVPSKSFKRPRQDFAKQIGAVASSTAAEQKNVDGSASLVSALAAWSAVTLVNGVAQGTTANTRIGRRLTITKVFLRWNCSATGAVSRFMVVYDHSPNGALPVITDILTLDQINGVNNLINNDRFMILHDEYVNYQASGLPVAGKWVYKGKPLQMIYTNAATGGIADITVGSIYVICVGTGATTLNFVSRVRYTDM